MAELPAWASTDDDARIARHVATLAVDRMSAVRVAAAVVDLIAPHLPPDGEDIALSHADLAAKRAAITAWIAEPTAANQQRAQHLIDPTRQTSAWRDFPLLVDHWILEATDFALHAIWTGSTTWYLAPPPPITCTQLAAICAARGIGASVVLAAI